MSKIKVVILGGTGMLGNAVYKHFNKEEYEPIVSYRNAGIMEKLDQNCKNSFYYDVLNTPASEIPACDYLINCIGITKPFMKDSIVNAININSLMPHLLAEHCNDQGIKMFHITTDCVFSGNTGKYTEDSLHDALDDYGKSKSLGEPINTSMTIRTSIIGEELHKDAFLISWAKKMKGHTVDGYTNHYWNGITTNEYARVVDWIIQHNRYEKGLFHIHANDVSKYEMVQGFNERWNLDMTINPTEAKQACDRRLRSVKGLVLDVKVKSFDTMIKEL